MVTRRRVFYTGAAVGLAAAIGRPLIRSANAAERDYPISRSEAEWRRILTPERFNVMRQSATERPFTSELLDEHRAGTFSCGGCYPTTSALFSSAAKFDSGTGWPSFWAPLPNAVDETEDRSFDTPRIAVSCSGCGGHLGHVFDDGPKPTGLRYCINGTALNFLPAASPSS